MELNTTTMSAPKKRSGKIIALIVVLVLILLIVAYCVFSYFKLGSSEYQAVFLSNGQVYFGKMGRSGKWIVLKDVYYLQVTQDLQDASGDSNATPNSTNNNQATQPEIKLVKLGSELHGPEDRMYIDTDKILFWEDMKSDSKVIEAIRKHTGN
jgi:hypothetical protein